MNKHNNLIKKYLQLGVGAVVLTGAFAASHPAAAQEGGNTPSRRQRGEGVRGIGPVVPPSVFDEQAKSILEKSNTLYRSAQYWHIEQSNVHDGRFLRNFIIDYRAPGSLVVTKLEAKGIKEVTYYSDDNVTTLRNFDQTVEYTIVPSDSGQRSSLAGGLGTYLSGFLTGEGGNVFGRQSVETVKYGGSSKLNGVPVDKIVLTVRGRGQRGGSTVTYFIGKQDSLLHKVEQSSVGSDGVPILATETYTNQKINAPIPDGDFQFTPPTGAVKVDRFSRYRGLQIDVGDTPFAITTKDIDGNPLSLDQYKGKVVLLDFWATWCGPCRAELPNLKAAYDKYKNQGFEVLGISLDISTAPLKPFIKKEELGWRNIYDGYWNGPVASVYNVRFIPTTILIGRDGKVVALNPRGANLEPAIQAALAGS